ncbi:pyridoxal-phosphate-dependent aminotransferase family protein [Paenactinomyces guangxiensis]|uniref:Alanine--glyoxylate aminotransferase family protein n=1 Tax=Paenactinomyces guangxiensis TaxID=1490290 RepID=A0A7W1WTA3_9BACL|nr:alanine--glyoxylate aminotransferase family protein [Paenactinomyces guangxiensis]MBA4495639.1 alanine--glyoxylate aminotransferase family protein [Paenactinomyces guangxiensis]MBH8592627.1 alanine--glyoxylate aminotransferase family protein [Paenactinomyces guangxiensis]
MSFAEKFHLRIPGPTPIPPRIQQAMAHPMIGHRSGEASRLITECSERLKKIFGTEQHPLLLSSSGTSALEAAVVNTVAPGEEAIVVVTGAFGDRFAKIVEKYGYICHRLDIPWGQACDPELLKSFIEEHPHARAVFFTYCETSTGVLNPIGELSRVVREHSDALVIVDAVSCLGAVPSRMDEWGIDLMVTGSQKALMLPPGLAFAAVSERAWTTIEKNPGPRFYLDLPAYRKNLEKGTTPFTPAVSLLFGLKEALNMLDEEGLENVIKRHELLKEMTRAGIRALGLELMARDQDASPTVTSIHGGAGKWESEELRKALRQLQVVVAGGQQHLKGKIFRIGHMGYCDALDIFTTLSALELALHQTGVPVELGAGVKAAQEVYLTHV